VREGAESTRRIVVELYGPDLLRRVEGSYALRRLESFEVLHVLRHDDHEFAGICRITPKDPRMRVEDCFRDDPVTTEIQVLQRGQQSSVALVRRLSQKLRSGLHKPLLLGGEATKPGAGYLLGPLEYRAGTIRFSFVGTDAQLREFLKQAKKLGHQFRVVALGAASFGQSPLDRLTEKQRLVLRTAHRLGYYEVPRRIDSRRLGRALGLKAATVVEHLRKAEQRLLDCLLIA